MSHKKSHASNLIGSSGSWTVESAKPRNGSKRARPFSLLKGGVWERDRVLSGAWWRFISELSCTNQIHAMWFTCDYHVTPPYNRILHACESGWCVAMPKRCIVMPVTWYAASCAPQKALDVCQTLPLTRKRVWWLWLNPRFLFYGACQLGHARLGSSWFISIAA